LYSHQNLSSASTSPRTMARSSYTKESQRIASGDSVRWEGEYLLDGDCWFPAFVFVEDGETDCSGGIHIRMKKRRIKLAYKNINTDTHTHKKPRSYISVVSLDILPVSPNLNTTQSKPQQRNSARLKQRQTQTTDNTLRSRWIKDNFTFRKQQIQLEQPIFPCSTRLPRNPRLPLHQIQTPIRRLRRLRIKSLTTSQSYILSSLDLSRRSTYGWSFLQSLRSSVRRLRHNAMIKVNMRSSFEGEFGIEDCRDGGDYLIFANL
jgi:hypothetical protein